MKKQTLIDLFEESVKTYASNTFLMEKTGKVWTILMKRPPSGLQVRADLFWE
ncbi:MAG: hypothetical protein ACLRRG_02475 [Barnesiella sp.]